MKTPVYTYSSLGDQSTTYRFEGISFEDISLLVSIFDGLYQGIKTWELDISVDVDNGSLSIPVEFKEVEKKLEELYRARERMHLIKFSSKGRSSRDDYLTLDLVFRCDKEYPHTGFNIYASSGDVSHVEVQKWGRHAKTEVETFLKKIKEKRKDATFSIDKKGVITKTDKKVSPKTVNNFKKIEINGSVNNSNITQGDNTTQTIKTNSKNRSKLEIASWIVGIVVGVVTLAGIVAKLF